MVMYNLNCPPQNSKKEKFLSILRLRNDINISVETVSTIRLILWYMKALLNSNKLKVFIAPKMAYLITSLENNWKTPIHTGTHIHYIYHYL